MRQSRNVSTTASISARRVGYEWGPWRLEEEFSFRQNGIGSVAVRVSTFNTTGNRNTYAFMTNLIYDFTLRLVPRLDARRISVRGIGAVQLHDSWGIPGSARSPAHSTWVFGYQGIAGVRYNINPALAFDLDYRYLGTDGTDLRYELCRRQIQVRLQLA